MAYSGALLDTSVWVAVFEGEKVADSLAKAQGDLGTVTSPIVLAELASLYARGRVGGGSPVDAVLDASSVADLTPEDAVRAGDLHGRLRREGHPKVALGDCLAYATARRLGALFVTCDRDLAGQEGVVLLEQTKPRTQSSQKGGRRG